MKCLGIMTIDGRKYRVVENLGYQQSAGVWAKAVVPASYTDDHDGRETAISRRRDQGWRIQTPGDRLRGAM